MKQSDDDPIPKAQHKIRWAILLYLLVVALIAAYTYYDASLTAREQAIGSPSQQAQDSRTIDTARARSSHDPDPLARVSRMLSLALVLSIAALPIFISLYRVLRDTKAELARELAEHERTLLRLPSIDMLTGQYNRTGFERLLDIELIRCKRYDLVCCLAELKIDSIDDLRATHGQIAAEAVLMQCGVRLATIIRGCDMLGRLDGERFGLILPRTSLQHGIIAVERIRAILAATSLGLPDSDERVQVSLSIGIAALQETIPERKHLQQLAHRRLERALQAGRGQLVAEAS